MIKNRTFLLIAANILLAMFIMLNLESEESSEISLKDEFSEMISQMQLIEFRKPVSKQKIVLKKNKIDWEITDPISWPAEPIALANSISKVSHLEAEFIGFLGELESKGEIPQDYGFDVNSSSLHILSKTSEIKITIGSLTRDQEGYFILVENGNSATIWHTPRHFQDLINRPLNEWARMTFFELPIYSIDKFKVKEIIEEQKKIITSLSKIGDKWLFSFPFKNDANDDEMRSLLHKLMTTKIIGFAESDSDKNLTQAMEIEVEAMDNQFSFKFYKSSEQETSKLLVKSNYHSHFEQDFYIRSEFLEHFRNLYMKLREKRLFSLDIDTVHRIRIVEGNSSLSLRKNEDNSWIGLEDNSTETFSFKTDFELVKAFVHKLNTIEVTNFIDFNPSPAQLAMQGFDSPQLRLMVELIDSTKRNILITKSNSETTFWSTYITDEAFTCFVNSDWSKLLSINAIDYKDRTYSCSISAIKSC